MPKTFIKKHMFFLEAQQWVLYKIRHAHKNHLPEHQSIDAQTVKITSKIRATRQFGVCGNPQGRAVVCHATQQLLLQRSEMNHPHLNNDYDKAIAYIARLRREHREQIETASLLIAISASMNLLMFVLWMVRP